MKRIIALVLTLAMLCSVLVFSANMEDTIDGLEFEDNTVYMIENDLAAEPVTIETVVWFNKRMPSGNSGGVVFGNFKGISNAPSMKLSIAAGGYPKLYVKGHEWTDGNTSEEYTCNFNSKSVYTSDWAHLAVVIDKANGEARCYVNGELTGTQPIKDVGYIGLCDFAVGGDRTAHNTNHFKNGKMRSLTVYSDVRTEAEIKQDMEKLDKSDLIVHYDFSALTEKNPAVLEDLSPNKNNATLNRVFFDEKEPVTDYAYSFAVIGDTQKVALYYPENFKKIYEYIYDNIEAKNIEMVIGLGDITDTLDDDNTASEWVTAAEGFAIIDNYVNHIPIRGNHDNIYYYNKTVGKMNYAKLIDGKYAQTADYRNTYVDIEIGGIPYLFLQLDFDITEEELAWACKVVESYPNHNVIVSRHGHLNHDYTALSRGEWLNPSLPRLSGEELWDGLLSKYENIVLCLSGHIGSEFALATQRKGVHGNIVTEMLLDYQDCDVTATEAGYSEGGLGTVNMFYFSEDGSKLTVETYATINGKYFHDMNQYTIELDTVTSNKYVKPEKAPIPPRAEEKTVVEMTIDSVFAKVNGETKILDAAPINRNSRTLLPVRFLAENLGAAVAWDDATKTATLTTDTTTIAVTIGAPSMTVNGETVALDSPAIIEKSRTYLPLRAIANALGVSNDNITWDDATKTATLVK